MTGICDMSVRRVGESVGGILLFIDVHCVTGEFDGLFR